MIIPWRIKSFVSDNMPIAYYLLTNLFRRQNSDTSWDQALAASWDAPNRQWPNRCTEIMSLTDRKDEILDVGCGTGSILRTLLDNGYENLHGVEHSRYAVEMLTERGIKMQQGKLPGIPYPANMFDIVIASEVLEHILFQSKFIEEMVRIVKPGGRVFIFVPNDCLGPIDEPSHVRKYSEQSLTSLLSKFGEIIEIRTTTESHFSASFLFAQLRKSA